MMMRQISLNKVLVMDFPKAPRIVSCEEANEIIDYQETTGDKLI
ncbi:hypothetical protein LCGC14_2030920 [marine sediment metagenome]|uniref:Uncharacterized protein n=1 Tax=marine sediment metagenome TaxID=412755 RepID=A0A0F9H851_9ZZZZ